MLDVKISLINSGGAIHKQMESAAKIPNSSLTFLLDVTVKIQSSLLIKKKIRDFSAVVCKLWFIFLQHGFSRGHEEKIIFKGLLLRIEKEKNHMHISALINLTFRNIWPKLNILLGEKLLNLPMSHNIMK